MPAPPCPMSKRVLPPLNNTGLELISCNETTSSLTVGTLALALLLLFLFFYRVRGAGPAASHPGIFSANHSVTNNILREKPEEYPAGQFDLPAQQS